MNKMLRILLCSVVALTLVTFAAAQNFSNGGVAGVHVHGAQVVLPPAPLFSNCGVGCTDYNASAGYYISGSSVGASPFQTLALGFTTKGKINLSKVLVPNTVYTDNGGKKKADLTTYLMAGSVSGGPTHPIAKLTHTGSIPDFPTVKTMKYTATPKPALKAKTTYFICQSAIGGNTQLLWMESNTDVTSPFFFEQTKNSCLKQTWLDATGNVTGAWEIN